MPTFQVFGFSFPFGRLSCFSTLIPAAISVAVVALATTQGAEITYLPGEVPDGTSQAVVVEVCALAHTAQLFPLDQQGNLVGDDSVEKQFEQVMSNLETALAAAGSGLEHIVKIEFLVDGSETAATVKKALAVQFTGPVKPVVNWVATPLLVPKSKVSASAVAVVPGAGPEKPLRLHCPGLGGDASAAHVSIMPRGEKVYLSGQPEKGETIPATKKAFAALIGLLEQMSLNSDSIICLKVFVGSMDEADVIRKEISAAFADKIVPPMTIAYWTSPAPVEIELTAWAPAAAAPTTETVSYFNPEGVKPSPVFSRAARVHGGKTIYIGTIQAAQAGDGETQVRDIFASLDRILQSAGSDMRHLVKATYYCADGDASKAMGKVRGELYDPQRPPAASLAMVKATTEPNRSVVLDMIAVTKP